MSSRLATLARPLCSKASVSLEAARLGWPSRLAAGEGKGGGGFTQSPLGWCPRLPPLG